MSLVYLDLEVFSNYFLCGLLIDGNHIKFKSFEGISIPALTSFLEDHAGGKFVVGHNVTSYDLPLLDKILSRRGGNVSTNDAKKFSDDIISKEVETDRVHKKRWPTVIDTIKYFQGKISLKALAVATDCEDIPNWVTDFDHLNESDENKLIEYNKLDLLTVRYLLSLPETQAKLKIRHFFSSVLGNWVYHSSEPSVAVSYLLKMSGSKKVDEDPTSFSLSDIVEDQNFHSPELMGVQEKFKNLTICTGKESLDNKDSTIELHGLEYKFGIGGLHAYNLGGEITDEVSDDQYSILDIDFASYYPNLILKHNVFEGKLAETYRSILGERMIAKHSGGKGKSDALKLVLNSVFGQLGMTYPDGGSIGYSKIYSRRGFYKTTINGQLTMAKVCEELSTFGQILQVNTDGLTIKTNSRERILQKVEDLSKSVGITLEVTNLKRFFARDVNNFLSVSESGQTKSKGVFAHNTFTLGKTARICQEAAISKISEGGDIGDYIQKENDLKRFLIKERNKSGFFRGGVPLGKCIRFVVVKGEGENVYSTTKNDVKVSVLANQNIEILENLNNNLIGEIDKDWYVSQAQALIVKEQKATAHFYGAYFPKLLEPKKVERKKLSTILKEIGSDKHLKKIEAVRTLPKAEASEIKKTLPQYIPHGEFAFRGKAGLQKLGNIIAVDIDLRGECDSKSVDEVKQSIYELIPSVKAVFLSPSNGIKVLIQTIPLIDEASFVAAKEKTWLTIEQSVNIPENLVLEKEYDIAKGFFLSSDSKILIRDDPTPLEFKTSTPSMKKINPTTVKKLVNFNKDKFLETSKKKLKSTQKGDRYDTRKGVALLAGGYFGGGALNAAEINSLKTQAIEASDDPTSTSKEWDSSFEHGQTRPFCVNETEVEQVPISNISGLESKIHYTSKETEELIPIEITPSDLENVTTPVIREGLVTLEDVIKFAVRSSEGISFGYKNNDEDLPLPIGAFTVFAAPTKHGKTQTLISCVHNAQKLDPNLHVLFITLEEQKEAIFFKFANRFLETRISQGNIRSLKHYFRNLGSSDRYGMIDHGVNCEEVDRRINQYLEKYKENKLMIVDFMTAGGKYTAVESLRKKVKDLAKEDPKIKLIVLDYLQLISTETRGHMSRDEMLKEVCIQLKDLAAETGVAILTAAQFNRKVMNADCLTPTAIGDAAAIERTAALVFGMWNLGFTQYKAVGIPTGALREQGRMLIQVLLNRNGVSYGDMICKFEGNLNHVDFVNIPKQLNLSDELFNPVQPPADGKTAKEMIDE